MDVQELPTVAVKRPTFTPKALIHQKYGTKACYTTEEVQQSDDSGCPGLVIPQQSQSLYRCCLTLPELTVTSDAFTKKKDAEQSAAKMAIEKLGIQSTSSNLTPEEACRELIARLSVLFSDEILSSSHPLVGHFRNALGKVKEFYSMIPLPAIASCDVKVNSLCKIIDPKVESDPLLLSSFIWKAARMSCSVCTTPSGGFWIWKHDPYSPRALETLMSHDPGSKDTILIKALRIPCSVMGNVETLSLDVSGNQHYMDEIAQKIDARDASHLLVSRTVGKSSSEMKLYFPIPEVASLSNSPADECPNIDGNAILEPLLNKRASYLSGQAIYGDAILANVGYTRRSADLFYENTSLCTYYRMILNKMPDGHYKLSREAILASELPTAFTARSNWKGPLPRDLLCVFCRQHRFLEPIFSVTCTDSSETVKSEPCKKVKLPEVAREGEIANGHAPAANGQNSEKMASFKCEVKILSRRQDIILECSSDNAYKKESEAIQSVALKVLTWFSKYFKQLDMPIEKLSSFALAHNIVIHPLNFSREFALLVSIYVAKLSCEPDIKQENEAILVNVEGDESGVFPSPGSLVCISYVITLISEGGSVRQVIDSKEEFEFEVGTGAVTNQLEAAVTQLSVNQATQFFTALPSRDLLFAAAGDSAENLAKLSLSDCSLKYSLKVLRITEPLEDRMEQAFFSPPLSKQRVEFAVKHINLSNSATLVDFGCGSGSLLDSLLDHSTTLERIIGVDISRKSLTRAAKIVHSKLSKNSVLQDTVRSAVLYDGSILEFDSRLYALDIGTCLEVIEHMEEDDACLFGDVVLSCFCPRVLIVSTPNYEYNPILQRSGLPNKEEESEEKSAACKFRNHDHKFEWTRRQFEQWASDLAVRHNYGVEFSGVGGDGDVEPGFASQIAVFRSNSQEAEAKTKRNEDEDCQPYQVIWEWNNRRSSI